MNPYAIIGGLIGAILLFGAGVGTGAHFDSLSWKAKVARQEAEAASLLDQLDRTAAAKDRALAESSRDLEASHANQIEAVSATAAAFRTELDKRLRESASRQGGGSAVSASTPAAGEPATAPARGNAGSGSVDPEAVSRLRDAVRRLQEDVKFCWSWAGTVGR